MGQKSKKKMIIIIFVIIALIVSYFLFQIISNKYKNKINKEDTSLKENSETQQDCKEDYSINNNNEYIYKVTVTNKKGAKVYDSYEKTIQKVVDKIENGKEIGIVADMFDGENYSKDNNTEVFEIGDIEFDDIKDYYYYAIDVCGNHRYIKNTDVSIIDSSINLSGKFDKTQKVYIYKDEELYSGPGLSFDVNNIKIPKGTILNVNTYNRGSNAVWLLVDDEKYNGWILEAYFNTVNYPYRNVKYGSATKIDEIAGELNLDEETELYRYAFSTNLERKSILTIPAGTTVKYDYSTSEPGITYYHINYNGNEGWINISN